jgi:hypothetical protein
MHHDDPLLGDSHHVQRGWLLAPSPRVQVLWHGNPSENGREERIEDALGRE